MKNLKTNAIVSFMLLLLVISCDKKENATDDENNMENTDNTDNTDNTEPTVSLVEIESGILIEGASTIEGVPPEPTGTLDFQMDSDNQSGYLSTGFLLDFQSEGEPEGAYILFKDENGNNATSYFDVPFNSLGGKRIASKRKSKAMLSSSAAKKMVDEPIEVIFTDQMPVGTFCYDICLYDAENNVSEIRTRCVTIDNWGGPSEFVGECIYDRDLENGIDSNYMVEIFCNNGDVLEILERDYTEWLFVLEADGDYYETYTDLIDTEASEESCTAIALPASAYETDKYIGKWTFNSTTNKFSTVDFAYESSLNPTENEVYETGEVYIDQVDIAIVNGELVLSLSEDGVFYEGIFKRKQ